MNHICSLGTIHELHITNPKYGLSELLSAIEQYKPDIIMTEVRPLFPSIEEAIIDGGIELSLVYAYAKLANIKIIPTDWFNDELLEEMNSEGQKLTAEQIQNIQQVTQFHESFSSLSLSELNSNLTRDLVLKMYSFFDQVGIHSYRKRNEAICANIQNSLSLTHDKRILILYGMDHKFFIDDYLKNFPGSILVQPSEWLDTLKVKEVSMEIRILAIQYLQNSSVLIQRRIETNYYPEALKARVGYKAAEILKWISELS